MTEETRKKLYLLNPVQLCAHDSSYKTEIKDAYNFDTKELYFRKKFQESKDNTYLETLIKSAEKLKYNKLADDLRNKNSNIFEKISTEGASISIPLTKWFANEGGIDKEKAQQTAEHIWATNCLLLNIEQKAVDLPSLQNANIIVPSPKMAKYPDVIETLCSKLNITSEKNIIRPTMSEEKIKAILTEDYKYMQKYGTNGTRFNFTNVKGKELEEVISMDTKAEQQIQTAHNAVLKSLNQSLEQLGQELGTEEVVAMGK